MEDFLYRFLSFYFRLPQPLKQLIGIGYNWLPRKIRYGSFYLTYSTRLKYFNNLSNIQDVLMEQWKLLHHQINKTIVAVPYYKEYKRINTIDEFRTYSIINKKTIIKSFPEFLHPELKSKRLLSNTGGSSGTPLEFFIEKNISRAKEKAHFDWFWGQFSYKPNEKLLMVRGLPIKDNRLFEYNTIDNILNVSCYSINESNISLILKKINQFKPHFIHAYPSSLKVITNLLENHNNSLNINIKAIFLGSEQLGKNDREYFEQFYKSKVVNWYGHSEQLIHGGNCPYSNDFHFYPAYGYMELLDENNALITQPGIEGRIVATGFDNMVMPFIRYDTGDLGILAGYTKCKCGFRGTSLSKIIGRDQDIIILSDLTKVSLTAFIFGQHLDVFHKIREIQVIQNHVGEIELNLVKNSNYTKIDEALLIKTLTNSVNNKILIYINYVETVSKTPRGKNIFFISNIDI
jgi:phenylacetate-CoA ligase